MEKNTGQQKSKVQMEIFFKKQNILKKKKKQWKRTQNHRKAK